MNILRTDNLLQQFKKLYFPRNWIDIITLARIILPITFLIIRPTLIVSIILIFISLILDSIFPGNNIYFFSIAIFFAYIFTSFYCFIFVVIPCYVLLGIDWLLKNGKE